jgi:hypothetical protein
VVGAVAAVRERPLEQPGVGETVSEQRYWPFELAA